MNKTLISKFTYILLGMVITICFLLFTGFRLPSPPEPGGSYQFFKEKDSKGVWVFEPETGISKYFDVEKGQVVVNSFQMDSISVKTDVKSIRSKE
jgi:hypothetical protein